MGVWFYVYVECRYVWKRWGNMNGSVERKEGCDRQKMVVSRKMLNLHCIWLTNVSNVDWRVEVAERGRESVCVAEWRGQKRNGTIRIGGPGESSDSAVDARDRRVNSTNACLVHLF